MKILMVGSGTAGGLFGARLLENKADVTFVVRRERKLQLITRGGRSSDAELTTAKMAGRSPASCNRLRPATTLSNVPVPLRVTRFAL